MIIPFMMMLSYAEPILSDSPTDYKEWIPRYQERNVNFDDIEVKGEVCDMTFTGCVQICIIYLSEEAQARVYLSRETAEILGDATQNLLDDFLSITADEQLLQIVEGPIILEQTDIQMEIAEILYDD